MTWSENVLKGLECCNRGKCSIEECPYYDDDDCRKTLALDAMIILCGKALLDTKQETKK